MMSHSSREDLKVQFDKIDSDGSGKITFKEVEDFSVANGSRNPSEGLNMFFGDNPANGDASIDFEQFVKLIQFADKRNFHNDRRIFYPHYGTIVTHIDHNLGGAGMYAHFSAPSWSDQIETDDWEEADFRVLQVRNNKVFWRGNVTFWNHPNSPTWGTTNSLVGHARRSSGAASGQWEAGDLIFFAGTANPAPRPGPGKYYGHKWEAGNLIFLYGKFNAANPGPGNYYGHKGTLVTHIDHNFGSSVAGQYAHFSAYSWSAQIGTSWDQAKYNVYQVRNMSRDGHNYWQVIWSGDMLFIQNPNSPTWGTTNKAVGHARRASGDAPGQWRSGDLMFARKKDAVAFLRNINHGIAFEAHWTRASKL